MTAGRRMAGEQRKLAAILMADVDGYAFVCQKD